MFAASARAQTSTLPLIGEPGLVTQADGSGSGETTTTVGGTGSGVTTTTVGGTGSGVTTTSTTRASTTTTTASGAAITTTTTSATAGPNCPASLTITLQSVRPGGTTSIGGQCFDRNVEISLVLTSDPVLLGTTRTDINGVFGATIAIPSNTAQGAHTLTASGGGRSASIPLLVSSSQAFGVTGMSWDLAILGLALVAAGIIVLAGDRIGKQDLIEFV